MRRLLLLVALGTCACDRAEEESAAPPQSPSPNNALVTREAKSEAPLVVQKPKDQAELDRMILAGYTPHGTHLHPPGMKKCPLVQEGNEAVM